MPAPVLLVLLLLLVSSAAPAPASEPSAAWPTPGSLVFTVGGGAGLSHVIAHSLPGRHFVVGRAGVEFVASPRIAAGIAAEPLFALEDAGHGWTHGLGFTLVGRGVLAERARSRFGADLGAGLVRFSAPVPRDALRTNFTLELGVWAERALGRATSALLGYRIHHISNADRSPVNPGINSSHVYVELRLWRPRA